jgi:hypothetical protein
MFKVGDRVVRVNPPKSPDSTMSCMTYGSVWIVTRVSGSVNVQDYPWGINKNDLILEEVFNSPLMKVMNE